MPGPTATFEGKTPGCSIAQPGQAGVTDTGVDLTPLSQLPRTEQPDATDAMSAIEAAWVSSRQPQPPMPNGRVNRRFGCVVCWAPGYREADGRHYCEKHVPQD